MNKHIDLGKIALKVLEKSPFGLLKLDLEEDARLKGKGTVFDIEAYDVGGIGRLSIMRMKAAMNILRMESVIFTVWNKDVPLFNMDWIRAFGRELMICELYDLQLSPYPENKLAEFQAIADRDIPIADYVSDEGQPHWYDDILYPCSYHKKTKRAFLKLSDASIDYSKTFVRQLTEAPECDEEAKKAKIREYAAALYAANGPAVDSLKKNFGEEKTHRIIFDILYGC